MSEGTKHDLGKPRMGLLPMIALKEVAKVLTFGAQKYDPWNWAKGFDWSRLYDAALRHIESHMSPIESDKDEESGLSHLAHATCCILFLLTFEILGLGKDDRFKLERSDDTIDEQDHALGESVFIGDQMATVMRYNNEYDLYELKFDDNSVGEFNSHGIRKYRSF